MLRRLLLTLMWVPGLAFAGTVNLSSLGVLYKSKVVSYLPSPAPCWGSATIANTTANPVTVTWTMTMDGATLSYGEWVLPAHGTALLTAINASTLSMGNHTLTLSYTDNAGDNTTESMTIVAENKPSWWN
jgi:hypothetical protein